MAGRSATALAEEAAGACPYLSVLGGESSRKLLYDGPAGAACGAAPGLGRTALRGAVTMLAARDAELSSAACSTGQHFSLVQRQLLQRRAQQHRARVSCYVRKQARQGMRMLLGGSCCAECWSMGRQSSGSRHAGALLHRPSSSALPEAQRCWGCPGMSLVAYVQQIRSRLPS